MDIELGDALARAHDARRIDGFIGRNHDESGDIASQSAIGDGRRAFDVVSYGFAGVEFEQWHVFIGCRMEDDFWARFDEDFVEPALVANIDESSDDLRRFRLLAHFSFDGIEKELTSFQEHEFGRLEG